MMSIRPVGSADSSRRPYGRSRNGLLDASPHATPDPVVRFRRAASIATALAALCGIAACSAGPDDPVPWIEFRNAVALADLDGDGRADLVTGLTWTNAVESHGALRVQLSRASAANGLLEAPVDLSVGKKASFVAVVDLDGDGRPDLVSASAGSRYDLPADDRVVVRRQDPARPGTFGPPLEHRIDGNWITALAVGDVDGDGHPDVLLSVTGTEPGVAVVWGDPSTPSGLGGSTRVVGGGAVRSPSLADLDGDGRPEIVFAREGAARAVYRDASDPRRFGEPVVLAWADRPEYVGVADLDGDHRADLVVADRTPIVAGYPGTLRTYLGVPDASPARFVPRQTFPLLSDLWPVVLSDLDGDRRPDVLLAETSVAPVERDRLQAFLSDPAAPGGLRPAVTTPMRSTLAFHIAVGDVDGDGQPEVAVPHERGVAILRQSDEAPGFFRDPVLVP